MSDLIMALGITKLPQEAMKMSSPKKLREMMPLAPILETLNADATARKKVQIKTSPLVRLIRSLLKVLLFMFTF